MKEARVAMDSAAGEDSSDDAEMEKPGGGSSDEDDDPGEGRDNIPATGELPTACPMSLSVSFVTALLP